MKHFISLSLSLFSLSLLGTIGSIREGSLLGSVDEELEYNNNNIDSNGLSSEATGSVIEGASLLNSQSLSSLEQSTSLERVRGVSVSVSYSQNNYNLKIFIY